MGSQDNNIKHENENDKESDFEADGESIEEDDDDIDDISMNDMLSQFFIEPKKQKNVTEVLCDIKKQMEIQNKILASIYTSLASKTK